jgi:hypothetical protein
MGSVGFQPYQLDDVRARLREMSDVDLLRFGRAAASIFRRPRHRKAQCDETVGLCV